MPHVVLSTPFINHLQGDQITLYVATGLFICAVVHTFFANKIIKYSHKFESGSSQERFCHFLGEIEIVFGFWAFIFILYLSIAKGMQS